jgi:hypothetical protein
VKPDLTSLAQKALTLADEAAKRYDPGQHACRAVRE